MNKINKNLKFSGALLILFLLMITGVQATSVAFYGKEVPPTQKYAYINVATKSTSTNYGTIYLAGTSSEKVTFSARSYPNGSYYTGTTVTSNDYDRTFQVPYDAIYGAGQEMQARFRNANYTFNSGLISGTFDYK